MGHLPPRTRTAVCFSGALFSILLSATPALAQSVTAVWDPSPPTVPVTAYQVCVGTSSMSCNVALASVSAPATSYRLTPAGGTLYYVATRATNPSGASPYSSEVRFSIPSFAQPGNQTSTAGSLITTLNLSIADPDGSPLTITHVGLPVGLSINSSTRQITGAPVAPGTYNVTLLVNDGLVTVSRSLTWTVIGSPVSTDTQMRPAADFNGDRRADMWRYEQGTWRIRASSAATDSTYVWGISGDIPLPADYDGDGRADLAVYRPSTGVWYILKSTTNYSWNSSTGSGLMAYTWGISGDIPLPADYDGDGRADLAVYRQSTGVWYILKSTTNYAWNSSTGSGLMAHAWGISGDIPLPADYDGDRRADLAVYRPSTGVWYILKSTTNYAWNSSTGSGLMAYTWGISGDIPLPADYDGDRRADLAIYRPSTRVWYILKSTTNYLWNSSGSGYMAYQWGNGGDSPVPADYDGDGRSDVAVWRTSGSLLTSRSNFTSWVSIQWP